MLPCSCICTKMLCTCSSEAPERTNERLSYQATDKLALQLHVVNGWQNVSENNHSKMLGTQVSYQLSPNSTVAYSTLAGQEAEFRHFHDFVYKFTGRVFDFVAQYDFGFQNLSAGEGVGN
ncbi:MAG: hypothetical protein EOO77_22250, partial [Oxalobacteraceae bacterium]